MSSLPVDKSAEQKIIINNALYEECEQTMTYVFESLCSHEVTRPEDANNKTMMSIKMMDTILFEGEFKPKKWIFTDLLGRIQFKEITSITIKDVIRAFLLNLNQNRK